MATLCRAVAIGDAHLGPNARQADRLRALDTIIDAGLALGDALGCWLWPGDVFHAKSTIADRNELAPRLIRMADAAPVVGCRGNHDAAGDLEIFQALATRWPVFFVERPAVVPVQTPQGLVLYVFALPWPEEGGLAAAGVAPGDVAAAAREALTHIFIDAGQQLATARQGGALTAFIGHCTVVGAVSSNGQPQAGLGIEIDAEHLAHLGDCPQIVNHIHKGQRVGSAIYPGSICRLDYGEVEPKRFLVASWFDATDFVIDERPLDVAGLWHIEGWLSRTGFVGSVTRGPEGEALEPPASWAGQEVRIRAKVHESERHLLDVARTALLQTYAEAARYQLELVVVPDAGLRAPAVAQAQTLGDKVQAWAEASGTALPALVSDRLVSLEVSDADALTNGVRRYMGTLLEQPQAAGAAA